MNKSILISILLFLLFYTNASPQGVRAGLVTYTLQVPEVAKAGKPFSVDVVLNIEKDWYIYAPTGANAAQGMIETSVILTLPEGIERITKMKVPDVVFKNGYEVLEGRNNVVSQTLSASKPGSYALRGRILWQTCNTEICLPPTTEEFATIIYID